MVSIGMQLVKHALHLLSGAGWPGLIGRHRDRRGLGDEHPPLGPLSGGP